MLDFENVVAGDVLLDLARAHRHSRRREERERGAAREPEASAASRLRRRSMIAPSGDYIGGGGSRQRLPSSATKYMTAS